MNDSPKNKGLRKKLVLELMKKGIKDENVLKSINLIPVSYTHLTLPTKA